MSRRGEPGLTFIGAQVQLTCVLDEPGLCGWLGVGPSHVDGWLKETPPIPFLELGNPTHGKRTRHERRFVPAAVLRWLRLRTQRIGNGKESETVK